MIAFVTLALIGAALLAMVSVFWIVPWCNLTVFRSRLWTIRDAAYDDLIAERFVDSAMAEAFVTFVEQTAEIAGELTAARLFFTRMTMGSIDEQEARRAIPFAFPDQCSEEDWAIFRQYQADLMLASVRHFVLGSPSGWVWLLAVGVRALAVIIARGVRGGILTAFRGELGAELEDDLRAAPDFVYPTGHPSGHLKPARSAHPAI